jgi:hypothetical protein
MSPLFKKHSALDRKLKRIEKDISLVDSEIKTLSRFVERPDKSKLAGRQKQENRQAEPENRPETREKPAAPQKPAEAPKHAIPGKKPEPPPQKDTNKVYEERFADYLASSFQTVQILRREKSIQRNKAIVAWIIVLLLAWLLVNHFLLP